MLKFWLILYPPQVPLSSFHRNEWGSASDTITSSHYTSTASTETAMLHRHVSMVAQNRQNQTLALEEAFTVYCIFIVTTNEGEGESRVISFVKICNLRAS